MTQLEMFRLLIPNALCWSSQKCNCALPAEVQLRLRVTRRSWQKLFASQTATYTGDLHIRWSTSCPPVDHRMSHPHASGNVPEVVHRMCRIRWTTGCAASGGPLGPRCVHAVDHWMCACSGLYVVEIRWTTRCEYWVTGVWSVM